MADEENTTTEEQAEEEQAPAPEPVDAEALKSQITEALTKGDFNEAKRLATVGAKGQKTAEQAALAEKQAALKGMTEKVKDLLVAQVDKLRQKGDLEKADHVKFLYVFADNTIECSLVKSSQARTRSGTGAGTGQKINKPTSELLTEYGDQPYKETGMTHQEAFDADSGGNARYAVRLSLLKLAGLI